MVDILKKKFPSIFIHPYLGKWLSIQAKLGLAANTLDAYARALIDYTAFCRAQEINIVEASREHIAAYVHDLATRPIKRGTSFQNGLANATIHQRLVAVRLFYDYLQEECIRDNNPLIRGKHTSGKGYGVNRRGLIPHYYKMPWIPNEEQWQSILIAALNLSIRNRFMLALAYDAGLRRNELCNLRTSDIDPAYRLISLRPETTKSGRARVVPYSATTSLLYVAYLQQRRQISRERGPLFLSESRYNRGKPITIWTWSKTIQALAREAGVHQFSTHTLRHLRLTDLARAGWELHEIATFAGHKSLDTTLSYIHLSGRELSEKLAKGMNAIHTWRAETMRNLIV
jgi:integrase/recombinase XerD